MAVTQEFSKKTYACNGAATEFDLATKVLATDDVTVFLKSVIDGTVETLVETTEYTIDAISGDLDNGVRVTTVATYSSDYTITLSRVIAETQTLELENGGDLPAEELEDALDRGVLISQQISSEQGRTFQFPVTDPDSTTYDMPTSEIRAGKAAGFDEFGNAAVLDIATEGGAFTAVNASTGLGALSGTIFGKVDDASLEFDAQGDFSIKDSGVDTDQLAASAVETAKIADSNVTKAKIEDVSAQTVLGNTTASSSPVEVPIVGATGLLLDTDLMTEDSALKGATQQSIKAYVDSAPNFTPSTYAAEESVTLPNGLVMKMGRIAEDGASTAVTFSSAFSTALISVTITQESTGDSSLGAPANLGSTRAVTGFNIKSTSGATHYNWIAIGY